MTEYGPEIVVKEKRPEWLRNDELIMLRAVDNEVWHRPVQVFDNWEYIAAIRLPADHPYYTVARWNAEHPDERPFEYWPGGDEAPADWDRGEVLFRDAGLSLSKGQVGFNWGHLGGSFDIIGYRRVEPAVAAPEPDIAAIGGKLTEPERERLLGCYGHMSGAAYNLVSEALHGNGLLDREWNLTPLGYRVAKWCKQNAAPEPDTVTLKRVTRVECEALYKEWLDNKTPFDEELNGVMLYAFHKLGLLAPDPVPETLADRYARETGREVTPELVAFAEWMEGQR